MSDGFFISIAVTMSDSVKARTRLAMHVGNYVHMGDDTTPGKWLTEMILPEACLDKPEASDNRPWAVS